MARDRKAGSAWLARNTRDGRRAARPVVVLGLLGVAAGIGQAWCIGELLAAGLAPGQEVVWPWAALFAALIAVRTGLLVIADNLSFAAGAAARRRLRTDVFVQLLGVGPRVMRDRQPGELASIAVDRIEALDGLFARWLPAATVAVAGPTLVALAVLAADPWAALVLVLAGLLVPFGLALAGLGAAAASQRQFAALDRLQARFLDRVRGIATIVLAGRAEDEARRLHDAAGELAGRTMRVLRVAFLSSAVLDCAAAGALVVLAVRYAAAWQGGGTRLAPAIFVLVLVAEFFAPLRAFSAAYQDRLQASTAAGDLAGLPVPDLVPVQQPIRTVAASGVTVAFEGVRYAWDPTRGPVLDDLSFRVPAGETVVLVGPSGAGKSTILELLLGFVRPDAGRITLNGADIASIVPAALARMTAWIGQNPVIFAGTIRDNIRFGREDAGDAEVEAAAKAARVGQFADVLPLGLDTPIGEGGYGLSGGQAQRVAIARAFVRNAPLLLLDEPTAHLDPATEADVLDSLHRLALGRTVILASHSAAAHAFGGRLLVLSGGRATLERGAA
jgi:ATP-binding cassette subfamily C protein CydD